MKARKLFFSLGLPAFLSHICFWSASYRAIRPGAPAWGTAACRLISYVVAHLLFAMSQENFRLYPSFL